MSNNAGTAPETPHPVDTLASMFGPSSQFRDVDSTEPVPEGYTSRALPVAALEASKMILAAVAAAPQRREDYTIEKCEVVRKRLATASVLAFLAAEAVDELMKGLSETTDPETPTPPSDGQ